MYISMQIPIEMKEMKVRGLESQKGSREAGLRNQRGSRLQVKNNK